MKILLCFGTRPEAIKMAPLYHQLKNDSFFDVKVCVTAQHRQMLDQVLDFFEITPDYDLDLMQNSQTLNELSARILTGINTVFLDAKPDLVCVHGDTTTSSMVALAAFHLKIKIAHIEAGLRTFNKNSPFPEEINRQITGRLADYHFAPTNESLNNLIQEKVAKNAIFNVGNTVIDALLWAKNKINSNYTNNDVIAFSDKIDSTKKLVLVTGHRRENFGEGFENLCDALLELSFRDDVQIVYPVHLNPNVLEPVNNKLAQRENIFLLPPADYPFFIWLMQNCFLIISDSGGIQEEAPTLEKPVLVTRNETERKEGVADGFSFLVGTNKQKIVDKANDLLDNFTGFENKNNPYGDGLACQKIVETIKLLK